MTLTEIELADEINRLHGNVVQQTDTSKRSLCMAVEAAWQAGKLLLAEQERVRRTMGAAWGLWVETHFRGSPRTAQNYMRLAESIEDLSLLQGMGLRQSYLKLGITTEPKSRGKDVKVPDLPSHLRLANRLLVALKPCFDSRHKLPETRDAFRKDLRMLYERLRLLFESESNLRSAKTTISVSK